VFVTHFLDQVYAISDRITVLRNGRLVGENVVKDLPRLQLVAQMVGRDVQSLSREQHKSEETAGAGSRAAPFVEAKDLGRKGSIKPLDLTVGQGEIVGLGGLLG